MSEQSNVGATGHLPVALRNLSTLPRYEGERISWESRTLERGTFELICSLRFDPRVSDHVKDAAIWKSLNECARARNFSQDFFLNAIRKFLKSRNAKKINKYTAVCQINVIKGVSIPKRIRCPQGFVDILENVSIKLRKILDINSDADLERLEFQQDFKYMFARVEAHDARAGLDLARERILFAIGLLNLATGGYGISHRSGYPNVPLGTYLTGSAIYIIDLRQNKMGAYFEESRFPLRWKRNFTIRLSSDAAAIENAIRIDRVPIGAFRRIATCRYDSNS